MSAFSRFLRTASRASLPLLTLNPIVSHPVFHGHLIIDKERDKNARLQGCLRWLCDEPSRQNRVGQRKHIQKVTLKLVSQAGHSTCRSPGRRFIRRILSHPGQEISTLATLGMTVKFESHDAHLRCAGRLFTPTTRTFAQSGQPIFSSAHFFRVTSCSTRTRAGHNVH